MKHVCISGVSLTYLAVSKDSPLGGARKGRKEHNINKGQCASHTVVTHANRDTHVASTARTFGHVAGRLRFSHSEVRLWWHGDRCLIQPS